MKKFFVLGLVAVALAVGVCSCRIGCKTRAWKGGKEISADGGTVVWRPTSDVNVQVVPSIIMVYCAFYDTGNNCVGATQLDVESQKIKGDGFEKLIGEEYEILASTNVVLVTLSANDTSFKREIVAMFGDGPYELGPHIIVSQSPKSWSGE